MHICCFTYVTFVLEQHTRWGSFISLVTVAILEGDGSLNQSSLVHLVHLFFNSPLLPTTAIDLQFTAILLLSWLSLTFETAKLASESFFLRSKYDQTALTILGFLNVNCS